MPAELSPDTLAQAVSLMLPHPQNKEYINNILSGACRESACESLFALAMLYELITELPACGEDTDELILARSDMGKPFFKGSRIKFNVSHSHGYVACAAAIDEELGVDIEAADIPPERANRLAKRYFTEDEQIALAESKKSFTDIWTMKESEAKFLGKSVANVLSEDKIQQNNSKTQNVHFHRFRFDNIPITLCTKRVYSTILFTVR